MLAMTNFRWTTAFRAGAWQPSRSSLLSNALKHGMAKKDAGGAAVLLSFVSVEQTSGQPLMPPGE